MITKPFYYGNYLVSKTGIVIRNAKARGTRIGRRLKPYHPNPNCNTAYVDLRAGEQRLQISIPELIRRVWK